MSNIELIVEEREADIGNFLVGRLLPFRKKRAVGPFVFIDHMGPEKLGPEQNLDIDPHPHIGLSTITYLFEGQITHRDSMGVEQVIKPGAINWMTAGKGVVHSERTPKELRGKSKTVHGMQIWVALPKDKEKIDPSFHHFTSEEIPTWNKSNLDFKLIAGEFMNRKSPVPVFSKLYFVEIKAKEATELDLGDDLYGETALYILDGAVTTEGQKFDPKQLLVAKSSNQCSIKLEANTTIYLFGGEPFPEERYIMWNFVSSDKQELQKAKEKWEAKEFDEIPGEKGRVPFPSSK